MTIASGNRPGWMCAFLGIGIFFCVSKIAYHAYFLNWTINNDRSNIFKHLLFIWSTLIFRYFYNKPISKSIMHLVFIIAQFITISSKDLTYSYMTCILRYKKDKR